MTGRDHRWLRAQRFPDPASAAAFEACYEQVWAVSTRRDRLDEQIEALAGDCEVTDVVRRLACVRGISTLTAFGLAVEIGDWARFTGASLSAFVGLTPTEHSSRGEPPAGSDQQGR